MTIIRKPDGSFSIISAEQEIETREKDYTLAKGENGLNYVTLDSVRNDVIHISLGNEKVGECLCFNFPIEYTCMHSCECYSKKLCYACSGCYLFPDNQRQYAENLKFFLTHGWKELYKAIYLAIKESGLEHFRFFTCGDIPSGTFITMANTLAIAFPYIHFWLYTKKYPIVNRYTEKHGKPVKNCVIIFSHWLNEDGTYFPMENPYSYPTSEFIPLGMEHLIETVNHVCPCSDPTVYNTCITCETPCFNLQTGQSMALCEHSTKRTKERDTDIRLSKKEIKRMQKEAKKAAKQAMKEAKKETHKAKKTA